jgi:S-adenosylmethionine:tRNA ribosyltransferase-isomerase
MSQSAQRTFTIEDFEYDLPADLIAQTPCDVRHESRLLLLERASSAIEHRHFADIVEILQEGDLLVVNNTRVIPARLLASRQTGGQVEILLLKAETHRPGLWQALANPLRKLKVGDILQAQSPGGLNAQILVEDIFAGPDGHKRVMISLGSQQTAFELLQDIGNAPLPPYIERRRDQTASMRARDLERYQAIFAAAPGAVAAPTAGLHFSPEVVARLKDRGVGLEEITLHVGPGTFKPISATLDDHAIEAEEYTIKAEAAARINDAKRAGRRVIAVGTTTCRALETAGMDGVVQPVERAQSTLYIRPGFQFRILDGLLTNFHLSRSSLLVLVSAFGGYELVRRAYQDAVDRRYRFFSYGDAMLIL